MDTIEAASQASNHELNLVPTPITIVLLVLLALVIIIGIIKNIKLNKINPRFNSERKLKFVFPSPDVRDKIRIEEEGRGGFDWPALIMIVLFFVAIIFMKNNVQELIIFFNIIAAIPVIVSLVFIVGLIISNVISETTFKFLILNPIMSFFMFFNAFNIPKVLASLTSDMFVDHTAIAMFNLLGIFLSLIGQLSLIIYIVRIFVIRRYRKNGNTGHYLERLIFRTRSLDKIPMILTLVLVMGLGAFLLTNSYHFLAGDVETVDPYQNTETYTEEFTPADSTEDFQDAYTEDYQDEYTDENQDTEDADEVLP